MHKAYKEAFLKFIRLQFSQYFSEYPERRLKKGELSIYSDKPKIVFAKRRGNHEYFVSFISHRESQIYVEVGWKSDKIFPVNVLDHQDFLKPIRDKTFDWPTSDLAVKLVGICDERFYIVKAWNFNDPFVWDRSKESFEIFSDRLFWSKDYSKMKLGKQVTEEHADAQVALIGGDIMSCLREFGIPFLEEAIVQHSQKN